ncbi:signal peptidase II [Brevibacillus centrosporus]|uniref:signal peptidase II n=1 Tax=Brevibacillus centrosporus TaxID=54910 RepID=UPI0011411F30|nr:signal peptidase II [Brevibacillus centrosporus]MEC2130065.1 signal peptidase II [Brevibacillus centrosporus]GED32446.1 lipoprotein signal peptidase [Brevibacillus centrosporus]
MFRYLTVAVFAFLIDQLTKWSIVTYVDIGQKLPFIPGFIQLTSIRNRGAAFGILQDQRLFFLLVTVLVLVGMIIYLRRIYRDQKILGFALASILGGALGNFVDRALNGEVVDMLEFTFINFPVFNMADVFITIGVLMIIIDSFWKARMEKKANHILSD